MSRAAMLKVVKISLSIVLLQGCTYVTQGPFPDKDRGALPVVQDHFGDTVSRIVYPDQNWNEGDSLWFYNTSQGSHLMDYHIFLHLEKAESTSKDLLFFRDNQNMEKFRFLTQRTTYGNEQGLPVGWVKDTYQGKDLIGFTCAACHTTQVNYKGVGIRIDGGPSMANIQAMFKDLESALENSLPQKDIAKFSRLADKVLGPNNSMIEKMAFSERLKHQYLRVKHFNQKDDPKTVPYGYGRLDAFGRIFNRIESIRSPSTEDKHHPATAPVSYPFLWDAPHHDFVQWNGIVGNAEAGGLGPLARNASQVMGVFATIHDKKREASLPASLLGFGNYSCSVRKWNQIGLERKIKHLWSPSWVELTKKNIFPPIKGFIEDKHKKKILEEKIDHALRMNTFDELARELSGWQLGFAVFKKYRCASCHQSIDRKDRNRRVIAQLASVQDIGTDESMAKNGIEYCGESEFPEVPGNKMCKKDEVSTNIRGEAALEHIATEVLTNGALWDLPVYLVAWATNPMSTPLPFMAQDLDRHIDFEVIDDKTFKSNIKKYLNVYKARPLNGIWATAPYLHNGSVPNLYELFLPSDCTGRKPGVTCRSKSFTVGKRELDVVKVGFEPVDDLKYPVPLFDTSLQGNSNKGHEYVVGVTPIIKTNRQGRAIRDANGDFVYEFQEKISEKERWALVEYLKSL